MKISRRQFLRHLGTTGLLGATVVFLPKEQFQQLLAERERRGIAAAPPKIYRRPSRPHDRVARVAEAVPGGTLDPLSIPKYQTPLLIPPVMPKNTKLKTKAGKNVDYYEIAMQQFQEQILPAPMPKTTVWGYGSYGNNATFNAPSLTIEATWNKPVRVKWINNLIDPVSKEFLPHILPVDQTLHWANPPGGLGMRDHRGKDPTPYRGPVPMVTHVHGAHVTDESDGYAEAWFLPPAANIPEGYATEGTWYNHYKAQFKAMYGQDWTPGSAIAQYNNDQDATTLWYHDHSLGMTRCNVYAGPAGFYILRGGPMDAVGGTLPGPAPKAGDAPGTKYYEIPIAIQDRSFNADGSLFFPSNRAFFEGLEEPPNEPSLEIPFIPDDACDGPSDISPIWNPEFFGNTIMVNGHTWPYLNVEPRRYRIRFLNGCNARFLILRMENAMPFYQIGAEGGFLPAPIQLDQLLMSPAERADVILDFTGIGPGTDIMLLNVGPDDPYNGGPFTAADPATTGQVMLFKVVPLTSADKSTPPMQLKLPSQKPLPPASVTRKVSLNELESDTVLVAEDEAGNMVLACEDGEPFGPMAAMLGTVMLPGDPGYDGDMPMGMPMMWMDEITENPATGATEVWEMYNFTMDAHPMHIHEVMFEVVNREIFDPMYGDVGTVFPPDPDEAGRKDTVIAYPGQITRVKATFNLPGLYVWHCHIVDHEDNEMMRPFAVGPVPTL